MCVGVSGMCHWLGHLEQIDGLLLVVIVSVTRMGYAQHTQEVRLIHRFFKIELTAAEFVCISEGTRLHEGLGPSVVVIQEADVEVLVLGRILRDKGIH